MGACFSRCLNNEIPDDKQKRDEEVSDDELMSNGYKNIETEEIQQNINKKIKFKKVNFRLNQAYRKNNC